MTAWTNAHGLPEEELAAIRERDRDCVYCHVTMRPYKSDDGPRTAWATIEHFNGPPYDDPTQVAICCNACNSSRGDRTHEAWFATAYCRDRGIDASTVAKPVRDYLRIYPLLRAGLGAERPRDAVCPTVLELSTGFDGPMTVPESIPTQSPGPSSGTSGPVTIPGAERRRTDERTSQRTPQERMRFGRLRNGTTQERFAILWQG